MVEKIMKTTSMITNFVDEIIENNTEKSFINETEFEFGDKYNCYKSELFKQILDKHFKEKNINYEFKEIRNHVVYFKIKLHDWIK